MGETHRKMFAIEQGAKVQESLRETLKRREDIELERQFLTNYLGSEEQLGSDVIGGTGAETLSWTARYSVDERFYKDIGAVIGWGGGGGGGPEGRQNIASQANALLEQAQEAAASGDLAGAQALKAQASRLVESGVGRSAGFNLQNDPSLSYKVRGGSQIAHTVGTLVKQGRDFLDPGSETSRRYRRSLTELPLRAIDMEARSAQRAARQIGAMRGAARSPLAEQAVAAASANQFATAKANVLAQAAVQFETYSRGFAADTVRFAQEFVNNTAGLRDEFAGAVQSLGESIVRTQQDFLYTYLALGQYEQYRSDARRAETRQLITSFGAIALGGLLGGIGGVLGAAAGSTASTASQFALGALQGAQAVLPAAARPAQGDVAAPTVRGVTTPSP